MLSNAGLASQPSAAKALPCSSFPCPHCLHPCDGNSRVLLRCPCDCIEKGCRGAALPGGAGIGHFDAFHALLHPTAVRR
eukprot:1138539-Pelagomonas_calceolata.AAC.1